MKIKEAITILNSMKQDEDIFMDFITESEIKEHIKYIYKTPYEKIDKVFNAFKNTFEPELMYVFETLKDVCIEEGIDNLDGDDYEEEDNE